MFRVQETNILKKCQNMPKRPKHALDIAQWAVLQSAHWVATIYSPLKKLISGKYIPPYFYGFCHQPNFSKF